MLGLPVAEVIALAQLILAAVELFQEDHRGQARRLAALASVIYPGELQRGFP
jgi:hypothetical protein